MQHPLILNMETPFIPSISHYSTAVPAVVCAPRSLDTTGEPESNQAAARPWHFRAARKKKEKKNASRARQAALIDMIG